MSQAGQARKTELESRSFTSEMESGTRDATHKKVRGFVKIPGALIDDLSEDDSVSHAMSVPD